MIDWNHHRKVESFQRLHICLGDSLPFLLTRVGEIEVFGAQGSFTTGIPGLPGPTGVDPGVQAFYVGSSRPQGHVPAELDESGQGSGVSFVSLTETPEKQRNRVRKNHQWW